MKGAVVCEETFDEELEEELSDGQKAALALVEHLEMMGADSCELPILTDDGCYIVKVIKTL